MRKIFNLLKKIILTFNNNLNYIYVNSVLKKEYIKNLYLRKKEKSLIGVIDNISHTPTFVNLEFLIYLKSMNYKNNYLLIFPFGNKIKTLYKKNDNFVKNTNDLRFKTILEPSIDLVQNFKKNVIFFANRYEGINFFKEKKKNDLILPVGASIFYVSKVNYNESFILKYLRNYKLTKKRVLLRSPDVYQQILKKNINFKIDEKIVTISLKEAHYNNARNSKINEWLKFASFLEKKKYRVILIPDITSLTKNSLVFKKLKNFEVNELAAYDIRIRLALYENSFLNFSTSSGTNTLLFNSKANYLIFSVYNEKIKYGTGSYDLWLRHTGIKYGNQFPFATTTQKIIWKKNNENFTTIKTEFLKFEKLYKK